MPDKAAQRRLAAARHVLDRHAGAAHFFIDGWEAGMHSVEFFVRAEVEGEVFAPLPEFEPMYGGALPIDVKSPTKWVISKQ